MKCCVSSDTTQDSDEFYREQSSNECSYRICVSTNEVDNCSDGVYAPTDELNYCSGGFT